MCIFAYVQVSNHSEEGVVVWAGTPPSWKPFLLQLAEWTGAVILARIICGSVVFPLSARTALLPLESF